MDTGRIVACALAVVLLAVSPVAAAATAGPGSDRVAAGAPSTGDVPAVTPDRVVAAQSVDPDTVLLRADVGPDGTATWRIEYLVRLDDRNTTDAFESVATDIENDPTRFTDRFADRMARTVGAAENATGREMAVANVSVETERQDLGAEYGVVRYEFTWTNFAAANETSLRVGDALGGFFLDSETQLTVAWPSAYDVVEVSPPAADRSPTEVVWQGQQSFSAAGPRVIVATNAPTATRQGGAGGGGDGGNDGTTLVIVAVVAAVVALAVAWVVTRRRGADDQPAGGAAATGTADADTGGAAAAAASDDAEAAEAGDDEPPEELLSNEERVLKLLEDRGGRVKQQEIAGELDWTDAKTSQVVTGLREDEDVEVFRLGRENVVSLPDEDDI